MIATVLSADHKIMITTVVLFEQATENALDTIRQRNQAGKATFMLSSQPILAETAQAAYLLP